MNHFTDDQIYDLVVKVTAEAALSPQQEEALMHITQCNDCYHRLASTMAMLEVAGNMGALAADTEPVTAIQSTRETIRAVLKLTVSAVHSALDQLTAGANGWIFRSSPSLLFGARGLGGQSETQKLTDTDNPKNFVAYDPGSKTLMIQLDPSACSDFATVLLTTADGVQTRIPFERQGGVFWAEAAGLEDGDYTITLER